MNNRKEFTPKFKKNGDPRKGYSEWGEKLENIKMRKNNSEWELTYNKTFFNGEYDILKCINCGGEIARKIYMNDMVHYAKYECINCYRILKWIPKPKKF